MKIYVAGNGVLLKKYNGNPKKCPIYLLQTFYDMRKQSEQKGGCAMYRNMEREKEQFDRLRKKWGNNIVKMDISNKGKSKKKRKYIDYNPIIKVPIKGV